ncbi:dna-directed RNA polymerase ii subunit protein [Rutstroemia sp. NJR-2017a WRK4]|nr:dna-directed RNA polymerase ii subunit protein [Rutstroemia sp. NJR-2017a WRK4]
MSNAPERFELFILGEGEKKCTEAADTLANLLRAYLLKDPHVLFSGYKSMVSRTAFRTPRISNPRNTFDAFCAFKLTSVTVPHPLFSKFELRIQTDGEITPKEALVTCCRNLVSELEVFSREFTKEFELRKMVSGDAAAAAEQ